MRSRYKHGLGMVIVLAAVVLSLISCLKDIPETVPSKFEWNPEVAFPLGEESFGMNTISGFDTLMLILDTLTGIPEWVREFSFAIVIEGTIDFDLSNFTSNLEYINRIMMRVNIYNGFPDNGLVQAYFRDQGETYIDSMFVEGPVMINGGKVKDDGAGIDPSHVRKDAVFDKVRIAGLQDATEIQFQATIPNPELDSALIPYYPDYHIDVKVGAMLDLSIDFD